MAPVHIFFLSCLFLGAAASDGSCQAHDVAAGDDGCQTMIDAAGFLQLPRQQQPQQQQQQQRRPENHNTPLPVARTIRQLVTGKGGWLDAHQHFGAGANWMGQAMIPPWARVRMQQLFDLQVWKDGIKEASSMKGFVMYHPINEGMGVDDLELYSIFARMQLGGLNVSSIRTPGFAQAVEETRVDLEDMAATFIVGPGLIESITQEDWNNRAVTQGSGTIYPLILCLEAVQNMTNSSAEKPILRRRLLRTLLSSSPLHDFDSGYVTRKMLYNWNQTLQARYEVQESIDAGIVDSQIFTVSAGEYPGTASFSRAAYWSTTGNASVKSRWYSATVGCNFAQNGSNTRLQEWSAAEGRIVVTEKNSSEYPCFHNLPTVFDDFFEEGIIGMDSLSPESFVFSGDKEGREPLINATRMMLRAAKQKDQHMVMHLHIGEGSPTYDFLAYLVDGKKEPMSPLKMGENGTEPEGLAELKAERYGMREDMFGEMCAAATEEALLDPEFLPVFRVTQLGAATCPSAWPLDSEPRKDEAKTGETRCEVGEPAYYETARMNLDTILDIIDYHILPKPEFQDLGRYIKFRFGHATHATPEQTLRMSRLGISVDLNLASNMMTGSLYLRMPTTEGAPYGAKQGILNSNQWASVKDFFAEPAKLVYMFRRHTVLPMLLSGTHVMLGTDGSGVEKSDMSGALGAVDAMLNYYNEKGPVPVVWFAGKLEQDPMSQVAHQYVNQLYSVFGRYERGPLQPVALKNQWAFARWLDATP